MHCLKACAMAGLLIASGCTSSGHAFDAGKLSRLEPGRTTLAEAVRTLAGAPDQIYPQSDGTMLALWRFHRTYVPDGLYGNKEALLQFASSGLFMRLVESSNIALESAARVRLSGPEPAPAVAPEAYAPSSQRSDSGWIVIPPGATQ